MTCHSLIVYLWISSLLAAYNILTYHFHLMSGKKCKRSSQKVYSTDVVSATEFPQISEIDNVLYHVLNMLSSMAGHKNLSLKEQYLDKMSKAATKKRWSIILYVF